ncbi:MAG: NusG domain II-containing protein [Pseudoflavonifractor sp.]|nr:NusG domain II-containing protein [Pseudoflavonifractor sp.]MDY3020069.1 NusG domain II-containing protein [Oscillospiraceae bacterium]
MKKTLSNRFWLILLGVIVAGSALAAWLLLSRVSTGSIAAIYLDGELVERIDLAAVTESYTRTYTGKSGITDVVEVARGKIRVKEADCPDQVCVHQGWIETGVVPVVCLPNALVIQIEDGSAEPEIDGAVG